MSVGVVVVAYGAPDLLDEALAGVQGLPVVVVDNSSLEAVRSVARDRRAHYVDPGRNLGFGAGVNLGVRELWSQQGRTDVLLLNPDAVVRPGDVAALHDALHARPGTAAVSPLVHGADGPQRVSWPFPSPRRMWREALGLLGASRQDAEWLVGAALMLAAPAYEAVGPFDERFFLYCEETDWQHRAVLAGWSVQLVPEVSVAHVGGGTSSDPSRREALFHAGNETYVRKWFGARGWHSYRAAALLAAAVRSVLPGERGAAARHRVRLYARGPRRVAGLGTAGSPLTSRARVRRRTPPCAPPSPW